MPKRKQCETCRNYLSYIWVGEGYRRQVHSCREHLPLYEGNCRVYLEKKDEEEVTM